MSSVREMLTKWSFNVDHEKLEKYDRSKRKGFQEHLKKMNEARAKIGPWNKGKKMSEEMRLIYKNAWVKRKLSV